MSSSSSSAGFNTSIEEQLELALQRAAVEGVLSTSRTYLTACFALYAWDFVLTFPGEYRAMWKAERWTPVRVSFLFNRYWGLLTFVQAMVLAWIEISPKTCDKIQILEPIATTILFLNCEFLLGARVWAVSNRRPWIAYFFGIFAISGTAIQVWSFSQNTAVRLLPGLRGCISNRGAHNYIWAFWVPVLLYDTTATVFMLIPVLTNWRNVPPTRLLTIFMRDGVLYFIIVSACNLVNVIYFSMASTPNPALNGPLAMAFTTMMASRIVLHLRSAAPRLNSREGDINRSDMYGRSNTAPKFRSANKPDVHQPPPDSYLQSVGRRTEGELPVSYVDVIVNIETEINDEKRKDAGEESESRGEDNLSEKYVGEEKK
ncbi:hypothetical protein BT69DRAFT_1285926 [Atractiella rhizophila]|nr:hypothetical protein BT69DRAFT_1285926 [Atractiella rhizophila]